MKTLRTSTPVERVRALLGTVAAAVSAALLPGVANAEYGLNLQTPATPIAREIMTLHNGIMFACFVIFILVFSVMFYSLFAHRKSRGYEAAKFSHSTKLEILWTLIPTLILVGFAYPSTGTLIAMEDTTESELTVKVTAYQWKWHYEYMEYKVKGSDGKYTSVDTHGANFYSTLSTPTAQILDQEEQGENYLLEVDNDMIIPAQTKVRLLITSADVLHAWWIPKFGVKKDAIPGYINEAWINVDGPGIYRGQCVELCGKDHGYMPIVAEVKSKQDFAAWLSQQKAAIDAADSDVKVASTSSNLTN